jgi:hypothetical protein
MDNLFRLATLALAALVISTLAAYTLSSAKSGKKQVDQSIKIVNNQSPIIKDVSIAKYGDKIFTGSEVREFMKYALDRNLDEKFDCSVGVETINEGRVSRFLYLKSSQLISNEVIELPKNETKFDQYSKIYPGRSIPDTLSKGNGFVADESLFSCSCFYGKNGKVAFLKFSQIRDVDVDL